MNKYITAVVVALATTAQAQMSQPVPRLIVNITIDQLRTDYLNTFSSLYSSKGLKKLFQEGCVYDAANYSFTPVDEASAIASITTGTTPYYNDIISNKWLDRKTLRPTSCVDDPKYQTSPSLLAVSTIGDELKVSTDGAAIIYSFAASREAAVLAGGHAADGAFWIDDKNGEFNTSPFYPQKTKKWIDNYNGLNRLKLQTEGLSNSAILQLGQECVVSNAMGRDEIPDMLFLTLSAKGEQLTKRQEEMESLYMQLDNMLGNFITNIESAIGKSHVLFVITSTGYSDEPEVDYSKFKIPTGTFYINRTANLLNMYLGAIYGQGRYIESCFHNEIFLNHKLIEQKLISFNDILNRSKDFLIQSAGVKNIFIQNNIYSTDDYSVKIHNGYNPKVNGDIIIEIAHGWKLLNEDTQENFISHANFIPFPIIFYGAGIKPQRILQSVQVDRIAPTIAKTIHIRAPNSCSAEPLF